MLVTPVSSESISNKISTQDLLIIAAAVSLVASIYLLTSHLTNGLGFPLDDSWIHQTYARNFALRGEWAFRPGIPSAGSTAPLWSALLSIGFLLHLAPYLWSYVLGAAFLFALAVTCEWAVRKLLNTYKPRVPWVGIFFALEWHLVWAGMSGMETMLHAFLTTLVLAMLMTETRRYLTLGLLTGLAVWVRPDGLTLAGPVLFTIVFAERTSKSGVGAVTRYSIGFGSLFVPYLLFNLAVGGVPMPNTFYAKQAEYVSWQALPVLERLAQMGLQLLAGPGIALVPGMLLWLTKSFRQKMWGSLGAFMWCVSYLALYVSRLPAYQHGRYQIPALPVLFLFGLLAMADFEERVYAAAHHRVLRIVSRAAIAMLSLAFVFLGARSYAQDVALINTEMVVTAKWAAQNLPNDALIAAHDIGALGYFDSHALIDLAGLISPDVIPFIRDERRLAVYLDQERADYLIAFPDFYPSLIENSEPVFSTNGPITEVFGKSSMTVYRWKRP